MLEFREAVASHSDLARQLRAAREARGLSLDEAARMVRIRKRYLEAMERGDFSHLPEGAPARGFVRNYARFLGLNPEAAVAALEAEIGVPVILREAQLPPPERPRMTSRYTQLEPPGARWRGALPDESVAELDALALGDEGAANGRVHALPSARAAERRPTSLRLRPAAEPAHNRYLPPQRHPRAEAFSLSPSARHSLRRTARLLALLVLVVSAAGLAVPRLVPLLTTLRAPSAPASSTLSAATQAAPATIAPPAEARPTPLVATSASSPTPAPVVAEGVQLVLDVRERAWVRVRVDQQVVFEGFLPLGPSAPFSGNAVAVETANAGAFEIILNGQRLGVLGERNRTVRRTWTAQTP
ncbi:MAG: helix-turn-helix transcriptional regulator [Anaerolineae bacterium]|nr:helix-turn-helix domain-containing protein [Thermoflexales bacterium]MDW8053682.1 helix-turn-helix transcriptional regulator [Anaerolineae bacterium]